MAFGNFTRPAGNAITHSFEVEFNGGVGLPRPTLSTASLKGVPAPDAMLGGIKLMTTPQATSGMPTATTAARGHTPLVGIDAQSMADGIGAMKSGVFSHLDMSLSAIYRDQVGDANAVSSLTKQFQTSFATDRAGNKVVVIDVTAHDLNGDGSTADDAIGLEQMLQGIGVTNLSHYAGMVSGAIKISDVDALGHLLDQGNLGFARASAMQTGAGLVNSQADVAQHGDIARSDFGVDGSGVGVGVLSDSFDANAGASDHMADNIASGDLPNNTTILQDIGSGSDEGRGMAQLIHDIAPGASIEFATAFTGQAGFANNIIGLALDGNQIIVDDVIYYAELAYQEGPIAQAVTAVHDILDVSYFSSAGNNKHEGLEQAWADDGTYAYLGIWQLMEFAPGQDYLPITLAQSEVIILQWDEPGASAGGDGSASDLDLFLTNQDGSIIYATSLDFNEGGDPVEGFGISGGTGHTYYLRVGLYSGPAPTEIKIVALGNGAPVDLATTTGNFNDGTMYGHAAADGATAVGAVRYDATPAWGVNPPDSESFTSGGPTRIWFDNAGVRLAAFENRHVDISAVDGANTTFFGFDYDLDGHPNFFGTSASAPDCAAVAALLLEANPGLTSDDVNALLVDSALDMNNDATLGFDNGPDEETGAGLVQADLAVGFASTLHIENPDAVVMGGTHFNDDIVGNGNINIINGEAGDDRIAGGIRGDTLIGGLGDDNFVYLTEFDSIKVRFDTILDLENTDQIDLNRLDADSITDGNQDFVLVNHWSGTAGEIVLNYHKHGAFAGATTLRGYTDGNDHKVDVLIVLAGNHEDFSNFDL